MYFLLTLAEQVIPTAEVTNMVTKAVDSVQTDNAKIAMWVIAVVFLMWVVDLIAMKMPLNKARIKSDAKVADAVEALATNVTNNFKVSMDAHATLLAQDNNVKKINDKVSTLISIKRQELDAMEIMANKSGVDLSKQIDRAQGSLNMLTDLQK